MEVGIGLLSPKGMVFCEKRLDDDMGCGYSLLVAGIKKESSEYVGEQWLGMCVLIIFKKRK